MKNKLLLYTFFSIVFVGVTHFFATLFYLYWTVWWFDNITHFFGGLAMGFLTFLIVKIIYPRIKSSSPLKLVIAVFVMVMIIGVSWEIFEWYFGIALPGTTGERYWADTTLDLVADAFGAITSALIIYKKKLND